MNELNWLKKNRNYKDFDESGIKNILYFTLIWNIFEKDYCSKDAKINIHPIELSQKLSNILDEKKVDFVFLYFRDRYITNTQINELFSAFKFGKTNRQGKEYKKFVEGVLLNPIATMQEKIQSLLYIAFRLRNNLYHGIKNVEKLANQNENFRQINSLLMDIIDKGEVNN